MRERAAVARSIGAACGWQLARPRSSGTCLYSSHPHSSVPQLYLPSLLHSYRSFWNGIVDRLKQSNEKGLQRKQEKRDKMSTTQHSAATVPCSPTSHPPCSPPLHPSPRLPFLFPPSRDELRSLSVRQMQILMMDRKPPDVATPLQLTDAAVAPLFLPPTTPCHCINLLRQPIVLPQLFQGRLTLLHIAYNAHAFQLGQKWLEAAQAPTWPPPAAPSAPSVTTPAPSFPPLSPPAPPPTPNQSLPHSPPFGPSSSFFSTPSPCSPLSPSSPPLQFYQMSLISNSLIRRWFGPQTLSSLAASIPPSLHATLLSVLDDASMAALEGREEVLGLAKQEMLGYVFLLDGEGRVRWRAWGEMLGDDAAVMRRVVEELKEEVREKSTQAQGAERAKLQVKGAQPALHASGVYEWKAKAKGAEQTRSGEAARLAPPVERRREGGEDEEQKHSAKTRAVLATNTRPVKTSKP